MLYISRYSANLSAWWKTGELPLEHRDLSKQALSMLGNGSVSEAKQSAKSRASGSLWMMACPLRGRGEQMEIIPCKFYSRSWEIVSTWIEGSSCCLPPFLVSLKNTELLKAGKPLQKISFSKTRMSSSSKVFDEQVWQVSHGLNQ